MNTPDTAKVEKMRDMLTIDNFVAREDYYTISLLVQKSIRFEPFKKLAIYYRHHYLGNYEIHSKKVIPYTKITNELCVMLFGQTKKDSENELRKIHKKGLWSSKAEYYFIILFKIGENKTYQINPSAK